MRTAVLRNKLERYLEGNANPAEIRQVQTWLSCTAADINITAKEKQQLEKEIRKEIHEHTGSLPEQSFIKSFFFH